MIEQGLTWTSQVPITMRAVATLFINTLCNSRHYCYWNLTLSLTPELLCIFCSPRSPTDVKMLWTPTAARTFAQQKDNFNYSVCAHLISLWCWRTQQATINQLNEAKLVSGNIQKINNLYLYTWNPLKSHLNYTLISSHVYKKNPASNYNSEAIWYHPSNKVNSRNGSGLSQ